MKYFEKKQDLFTVSRDYHLAHCIATDLGMGAGIAVPMQKKFNLRKQMVDSGKSLVHPTCILTGRVFNLITKERSNGKPTYKTILSSIQQMKKQAVINKIDAIAMPKIGCGLDRLEWPMVREFLIKTFEDTDIELLVCYI